MSEYMGPVLVKSLASCHVATIVVYLRHCSRSLFSRAMSSQSHSKDTKNPRFGHLPLSTSGPEQCALTVMRHLPISALAPGLTSFRVHHSSALHITIKDPPFLRTNAGISSSMVCCPQMCKRWMNKSNVHMNSIPNAEVLSLKIPS